MQKLLIVEDDRALSQGIVLALAGEGYDFGQCVALSEARDALAREGWDLVILDINLSLPQNRSFCRPTA